MKTKLNTAENRAKDYCEDIKNRGEGSFTVEWKRSQMYGMNPTIQNYRNQRMVSVSGCGYCKHSTALADFLRFLGDTDDDMNDIWKQGGCGVDPVIEMLKSKGWELKRAHWTKISDTYTIKKVN